MYCKLSQNAHTLKLPYMPTLKPWRQGTIILLPWEIYQQVNVKNILQIL